MRLVVPGAAVQGEPVDPRRLRLPNLPLVVVPAFSLGGEADHVVGEDVVPYRDDGLGSASRNRQQQQ